VKHVLVVEDDPVNAMLFERLLARRGGYRVTLTESPEEVFRHAREGVDLILLDVSLADSSFEGRPVSGVEICQRLKRDPATASVPVILATAHAMRGDEESLIAESGAEAYVAKPIEDHGAFMDQIRRVLEADAA
jgi:CheY-like chemotaxis protein